MKQQLSIVALGVYVILQILPFVAKGWETVIKEKKTHNQYTIQDMNNLVIDNMYGKVQINTWDKNEVTIDITVTAKAKTELEAQEILDRISFVMSSNEDRGHKISCKTVLSPMKHNINNSSMTIDYTINAPKKDAIDITDKFGDVYLGDFSGKMRMDVSYGGLTMQTISGSDKYIKVAFGSTNIHSIESGIFDVSYTNMIIDKAGDIVVTNKYGKLDIEDVKSLKLDQRYGDIEIGSASQIGGNIEYANIEIGALAKKIELTLKYCGKADMKSIEASAELVNIEAYYSNISCRLADGADLFVDISTTSSSVKKGIFSKSLELVDINPNNLKSGHYRGKTGKGDGSMIINANYSNINFK